MYGPFFCGSLASATAFKTSLLASAIDAVGPVIQWSDKGPFGSGSEAEMSREMSTLLKYLQSSKQFVIKHVYAMIPSTELKRKYRPYAIRILSAS